MTLQSCFNFCMIHLVSIYVHSSINLFMQTDILIGICCLWCCMLCLWNVVFLWLCFNAQQTTRDHRLKPFSREWLFYLPSESSRCVHTTRVHRFQGVFYTVLYTSSLMLMYWRNKSIVKATCTTNQKLHIHYMKYEAFKKIFWIKNTGLNNI